MIWPLWWLHFVQCTVFLGGRSKVQILLCLLSSSFIKSSSSPAPLYESDWVTDCAGYKIKAANTHAGSHAYMWQSDIGAWWWKPLVNSRPWIFIIAYLELSAGVWVCCFLFPLLFIRSIFLYSSSLPSRAFIVSQRTFECLEMQLWWLN